MSRSYHWRSQPAKCKPNFLKCQRVRDRFGILDLGLNKDIAGDGTDPGNLVLDAETGFFYLNTAFEALKMVENPVSLVLMGKSRSNSTIERTMNIAIERTAYGQLLAKSQPKPILNEEDNDLALAEVDFLMSKEELTVEEETLLSLWGLLIEEYESKYPDREVTPRHILLLDGRIFLMLILVCLFD
ncbi:hypothetical protein [Microcoleus asticus]|uniref:hypothetical protein n=1 Tax=Microcoleus asticus TaxID=2815231 RepID=UPI0030D7701E